MLPLPQLPALLGATIRRELAPAPGRYITVLRYVIASTLVIVLSMTLQIPFLALSLIGVFLTTQQNTYLTRVSGLWSVVGLTLAVAVSLLLLRLTYDRALLRIAGAMLILLGAMYFLRKSKLGVLGFMVGIVVISFQSDVDVVDNPEQLTRTVLWVWAAMIYPIVVNVLLGFFLPASADANLRAELDAQLQRVEDCIADVTAEAPGYADIEAAILRMRRKLDFALAEHPAQAGRNARYRARVRAVERLLVAANRLPGGASAEFNARYPQHAQALCNAIRSLREGLVSDDVFARPAPPDATDIPPSFAVIYDALAQLELADVAQSESAKGSAKKSSATTVTLAATAAAVGGLDPTALRFAIKVVLATGFGYVLYTAIAWPGIHTCMLTCIVLALPSLGAITHKGSMRLIGAAIGSVAAVISTVFIVPHLDGITGLLLLSLAVIAVGGWIAAGSPRMDYVGLQMVICFALALYGTFGPSTDLSEVRDRAVGIVLGVIISLVVYGWLWPEREAGKASVEKGALTQALARAAVAAMAIAVDGRDAYELARSEAWSVLERGRLLQGRLAFEPGAVPALDDVLDRARQKLLDIDWFVSASGGQTKP
jgi:multidrug resistance protein MdtO